MTTFSETAAIQFNELRTTDFPEPGARWRARPASDVYDSACADLRPTTAGVLEIEVTNNVNGETWHFNYQGVVVPFVTGASAALTIAALNTALASVFGAGKILEEEVTAITPASPKITMTLALGVVPDPTPTITASTGGLTSTFTVAYTTTPTAAVDVDPGLWVALDVGRYDPQGTCVKLIESLTDRPYGMTMLEGAYPKLDVGGVGPVTMHWPHGRPMNVARHFEGGLIGYADGAITNADIGATVYAVRTGARKGWSRKNDGGTSQITTGTVVANNGDTVGLTISGKPDVTVTSTADATATAVLLRNAINARADLLALLSEPASNAAAVLTLKFAGYAAHTVVSVSPATADVTPISSTTPVAATAVATKSKFMQPAADGGRVAIAVLEG